ncbi:hypothetical protein HQ544_03360 [Candidatus Falkowbacteria bacterium]|nr:hypothetical protein [Candidatus Falkowbacteria bacterium]
MNQDLEKPVTTKDLGEFTDEVIMPGVEHIVNDSEKRMGERIGSVEREVLSNRNGINTILEKLQRMQESLDKMGAEQSRNKLEVKVIDWLCKRVDVLESKLGVEPEPIPRE